MKREAESMKSGACMWGGGGLLLIMSWEEASCRGSFPFTSNFLSNEERHRDACASKQGMDGQDLFLPKPISSPFLSPAPSSFPG